MSADQTVHLTKREGGSSGAGFAWVDTLCGIEHGAVWSSEDVAKVDCEACLEAAADFGEKAQAQLYEIWNEQEIRERFNEPGPTPEQVKREDMIGSVVAVATVGALVAFGTAKLALDGFRSMFRKVKP